MKLTVIAFRRKSEVSTKVNSGSGFGLRYNKLRSLIPNRRRDAQRGLEIVCTKSIVSSETPCSRVGADEETKIYDIRD